MPPKSETKPQEEFSEIRANLSPESLFLVVSQQEAA